MVSKATCPAATYLAGARPASLAATMTGWLHQLTAITPGQNILAGHGVRRGKAMIATLRHRLVRNNR
jgi:hypothetical protein